MKILDFGLARAVGDDAHLTRTGHIVGTPAFMAPEQARGEPVDYRADLFSLGSVLYAMCTGRPPFRASGTMAVLKRVCEDMPRPIGEINPEIPDWLTAIIAKLRQGGKRRLIRNLFESRRISQQASPVTVTAGPPEGKK